MRTTAHRCGRHNARAGLLNPEVVATCREMKVKKLAVDADHVTMTTHAELNKSLRGVKLPAKRP